MIIITKMKQTIQRQAILMYLKETKIHPTAEQVYGEIKKQIPNISLGTVYRNLNLLVENGEIKEIKTSSKVRFDGQDLNHQHLIDKKTGEILDTNELKEFVDKIKKNKFKNFKPEDVSIIVYGNRR